VSLAKRKPQKTKEKLKTSIKTRGIKEEMKYLK